MTQAENFTKAWEVVKGYEQAFFKGRIQAINSYVKKNALND